MGKFDYFHEDNYYIISPEVDNFLVERGYKKDTPPWEVI